MAEPEVEQPVEHVVERTERFEAAPDALWEAITDPDLIAEWFGPVEIDLTPGGAITAIEPDGPGAPETIGVVETVEPPHRIGFVWVAPGSSAPSSVELEIDPGDDECGSILHVREVRIEPRWDERPAWFTSTPRACAGAGAAVGRA
jgi:uncharacterized protein YndB with AHSA1/START domain